MISDAMKRNIPSIARRDARAVVDRRGPVVFGAPGREVRRVRSCHFNRLAETTCSTGQPGVLAQPLDEVAAQPAAPLARERRDDDLVDALVVDRVQRRRERVGVHDLAVRVDALAAQLASARGAAGGRRPRALPRRSAARRSGSSRRPSRHARGCGRAARPRRPSRWRSRARSRRPRPGHGLDDDVLTGMATCDVLDLRRPRCGASSRTAPRRASRRRSRRRPARAARARP